MDQIVILFNQMGGNSGRGWVYDALYWVFGECEWCQGGILPMSSNKKRSAGEPDIFKNPPKLKKTETMDTKIGPPMSPTLSATTLTNAMLYAIIADTYAMEVSQEALDLLEVSQTIVIDTIYSGNGTAYGPQNFALFYINTNGIKTDSIIMKQPWRN